MRCFLKWPRFYALFLEMAYAVIQNLLLQKAKGFQTLQNRFFACNALTVLKYRFCTGYANIFVNYST